MIRHHMKKQCLAVLVLALFITSCATLGKTKLESVWHDETFTRDSVNSVMILGITEKIENRKLYEQTFAKKLSDKGIKAVSSLDLIPETSELTREIVKETAEKLGIDTVLVTHVVSLDKKTDFYRTPGRKTPSVSYYHNYDDYYSEAQRDSKKGHYIERVDAVLESNLYRVKDKKLIWSARSETLDSDSVQNLIESVIEEILNSFN